MTSERQPTVTDADARRVLFDNAAEIFGFDRDRLQPYVERVGFELSEVQAAAVS